MDNSKIIYKKNIKEELKRNLYKMPKRRQNALFFIPPEMSYSSFVQAEKLQNFFYSGKEKTIFSNITNNKSKKKTKAIKSKDIKKQNISLNFANINKFLNKENNNNKYNNKNNNKTNVSSKLKFKTKYINKIRDNINSMNKTNKNDIIRNYSKENKNNNYYYCLGNKKNVNNKSIIKTVNTSFIYTDYRQKYNDNYKSLLIKDFSSNKILIRNVFNNNIQSQKSNIDNNKNNNNKSKLETNFSKKKNKQQNTLLGRMNNNQNIVSKNIPINMNMNNMNNSSKLTNISSYVTSEKNINSKKSPNDALSPSNNINLIKEKLLLKFKSDLNENETQEYESKFLNFELGFSEKISNNNLYENLDNNKDINKDECEKSIEEIEKIANEIYNSEYKNKRISYIKRRKDNNSIISKDIGINKDIEEFKEGEEKQNVLTLYVNRKNK